MGYHCDETGLKRKQEWPHFNMGHASGYGWTTDNRVTRIPRATTWPIWNAATTNGLVTKVGYVML